MEKKSAVSPPSTSPSKNFITAQWGRSGCLSDFHDLPLILDNRSPEREKTIRKSFAR